jgi:hypothetical protein
LILFLNLQVMAHDSRYQNNQLFRALLERIQGDVDILVKHMSQRARALREEQAQARKAGAAHVDSDSEDEDENEEGKDKDGDADADKQSQDGDAAGGDGNGADGDKKDGDDPSAGASSSSSSSSSSTDAGGAVPAIRTGGAKGSGAMAALVASVPASTATVLRAQLPKMVEHVMSSMKTQLQDVHGQVKSLHSRLDRLETQLSDTRGLLKAQTGKK